jgi:hypothetical protein
VNGLDTDPSPSRRSRGGLRFRIAASAAALTLAGLCAGRLALAAFDEAPVPIGEVASLDGIVSGTVHLTGGRLVIYSGDRFQSNDSGLAVNFLAGGSLILCPHSQLQILAASQQAGMMLAFQQGGSQQPFTVHANDVVMTPDWRIQVAGDVPAGEVGTLQLSTSRRGELCLSSKVKTGQFFRVSELAGDSDFEVTGLSSIRIADGRIDNAPGGCSCEGAAVSGTSIPPHEPTPAPAATSATVTARTPSPAPPSTAAPASPATPLSVAPSPAQSIREGNPPKRSHQSQRPQDVAGYVRSFFHLLFGR